MVVPDWIWYVFLFAFGCCVGSFLNVVIYRLPKDKSLVNPPSSCPACGRHIRFYDNIPLVSWIVLGAKCRYCKAPISARYFIVELLTGLVFIGLFYLYFRAGVRSGIGRFFADGGWFVFFIHLVLLSALIAASFIDLQLWVIPLCICWFVTIVGFVACAVAPYIIRPEIIYSYDLFPTASATTGALAAGGAAGLIISIALLATGVLKRSYALDATDQTTTVEPTQPEKDTTSDSSSAKNMATDETSPPATNAAEKKDDQDQIEQPQYRHRVEMCREIVFLAPVIICSTAAYFLLRRIEPIDRWWLDFLQIPFIAGLLGSIWGYFVGGAVVWAVRILGTLGFGREAIGMGDVHLMAGAGVVVGPVPVVAAFFIAPFFGLAWALVKMFFQKCRQIPYGPFLSLGILIAMILHDEILRFLSSMPYHY
jgi:leader peptidase (prepilin peptidase)/N-methyltransferase